MHWLEYVLNNGYKKGNESKTADSLNQFWNEMQSTGEELFDGLHSLFPQDLFYM